MTKLADYGSGDAFPAEEPQALSDREQLRHDYSVDQVERPPDTYNWSMSGTHVSVSDDDHGTQFGAMAWTDFNRPFAYGTVDLYSRWEARWVIVYTNMSISMVEKRLQRYSRDQGWEWGGITDGRGEPLDTIKTSSVPGIGEINPGVKDWHNKEWSGTEMYDNPGHEMSEAPFYGFTDYDEDMPMTSPRTCSECGELTLDYNDWRKHVLREHLNPGRKPPGEPQPVVDLDDVLPANFNEAIMDKTVQRQSSLIARLTAQAPGAPQIAGPMPFIYDIDQDRIFVGHPGERHSDIKGRFTPGGIIEGLYDPKGGVQIRTDTDMPYTVRHMAQLWYAMHPELEIKSIFLMVGDKKYKLASANIGHQVRNLVATFPAAWAAYQALEPYGNVYAVGGIIRDVILGKHPKDADLMVQGVDAADVERTLRSLPGRVDLTGKQFGVFRYRDRDGDEVEIALPRTERSTGGGHRDFEVVTNPYISVGEDLARRDFTGNAMAVNLSTGDLIDPYRGAEDLKSGVLRTVSDRSFPEDPLRILRAFSQVARHGLDPDPETYHDLAAHAHSLSELPRERIQMELDKLMSGDDPAKAIDLMEATGVLKHVLPDVAATEGFDQKSKYHALPLNEHMKAVLRMTAAETPDVDVRWAAILHDIGKPPSQWIDDEGYGHYYQNVKGEGGNHDEVGADMARKLLTDLKFPNDRIARITHLIRHHMFPSFSSPGAARKFLNRVGDEHADDLLTIRNADSGGKGLPHDGNVPLMRQYVQAVRDAGEPTDQSMLAINGHDLIQLGMKPGPAMGQVLKRLTDLVLENPNLNTRDKLIELAAMENPDLFNLSGGSGELAKSANTSYMFHVAPTSFRESILTHGLEPDRDRTGIGVIYLFADELSAEEFSSSSDPYATGDDTWLVDVTGLRLSEHPDYNEGDEMMGIVAYTTPDSIPPDRLTLFFDGVSQRHKTANILDEISDTLDPEVFNHPDSVDPILKPKIAEWVKRKIYKTMTQAGWPDPAEYLTIVLTGSLTTYQWSSESDFDLSLWVDVSHFPEYVRADLIAMMIEKCDGTIVPGTTHPLQCFVVDSNKFSRSDLYKPGLRSAYDLDEQHWIVLPEKSRSIDVYKTYPEIINYARMVEDKVRMMLRYDKAALKVYWDFLHRRRFLDQRAGKGDYSESNIVYKWLNNQGLFPYISEATGEYIA